MSFISTRTRLLRGAAAVCGAAMLVTGCADFGFRRPGPESAPVLTGPAITSNATPLESVFSCYRDDLLRSGRNTRSPEGPMAISVGEVRDYTGKSSINEGAFLTQGGTLMVISALGRLAPAVRIHERFDPRVGELELIYADRRQLGDGQMYSVPGPQPGNSQAVPWLPYMGGTIMRSRYFIVGGITELNWNIQSGGIQGLVNNVGPGLRTFTANIGIDLRIVDTRSLVVLHTATLQKQVTGHEVELNVFRFFGSRLFDISAGTRNSEPVQFAVRATLELGVLELLSAVSGVPYMRCAPPAVEAGMISRTYDLESPRASEPAPLPPVLPVPLAPRGAAERGPAFSPGAARGAPAFAPGALPPQSRPDAALRPTLPPFLQGPQLLPPPGSLSLPPGGAGTPPSTAPISPWPDPQRQSLPAPAEAPPARSDAPAVAPTPLGAVPGTEDAPPPPEPVRPVRRLGERRLPAGGARAVNVAARDGGSAARHEASERDRAPHQTDRTLVASASVSSGQ